MAQWFAVARRRRHRQLMEHAGIKNAPIPIHFHYLSLPVCPTGTMAPPSRSLFAGRLLRNWALPCLLVVLLLATGVARAQTVTIITNPDRASIPLDRNLLRAIFSMRLRNWPDQLPARVFVMADDSAIHAQFCREQLGTYPYVLRGSWDRLVFTGTGLAPTQVSTEEEMKRRVETTPGGIGYLRSGHALLLPMTLDLALLDSRRQGLP